MNTRFFFLHVKSQRRHSLVGFLGPQEKTQEPRETSWAEAHLKWQYDWKGGYWAKSQEIRVYTQT